MGLISKTVKTRWVSSTKKHYESLGYVFTKIGDEFEVRVEDLPSKSHISVMCECDSCGKELVWTYSDYMDQVKESGNTYCNICGNNFFRTGKAFFKSFYDWCVENNRQDVLNRWDYELNNCSPRDISYGTKKRYYFKCDKHPEHKSELKLINSFTSGSEGAIACKQCGSFYQWCIDHSRQDVLDRWDYDLNKCSPKDIPYGTTKRYYFKCALHPDHFSELKRVGNFTSGQEGSITCKQCNSIAQYILDNFPDKDLYDVWDKDKNGEANPWSIDSKSTKKIWIKCQEKDYHGSYEIKCYSFANGKRCYYCSGTKTHSKDSLGQYFIDNYSEEFLHKIWSNKNNISPFAISPHSNKKIWWSCSEGRHEDYFRNCNDSFTCEFRCPKCVEEMNNSIIEEKTKTYLVELGYEVLTEHNCTTRPINPKTKKPMPYDNEIILFNGKHLIIEVHGKQHYEESTGFFNGSLKQRKLYDRYKKYIAWKNGYEYLELPYTAFRGKNKDIYKQMIDDKIKEILEKEEIA